MLSYWKCSNVWTFVELALLGSNVSTEVLSAIIYVYSFSHLNKELISFSSLDAQTEFQCGFEVSVINDSTLESSLDVRTNIQFGFQCDQCRQGTSSQYQYCYLDLVI